MQVSLRAPETVWLRPGGSLLLPAKEGAGADVAEGPRGSVPPPPSPEVRFYSLSSRLNS